MTPKHTATDFPVHVQYVHEISNRRLVGHASHLRHSKSQDPARSAPGMSTLRPPCIAFPPPRADTPTPLFHSYLSNPTHHVLPSRRARTTTDVHHYTATPSSRFRKSSHIAFMLCYATRNRRCRSKFQRLGGGSRTRYPPRGPSSSGPIPFPSRHQGSTVRYIAETPRIGDMGRS